MTHISRWPLYKIISFEEARLSDYDTSDPESEGFLSPQELVETYLSDPNATPFEKYQGYINDESFDWRGESYWKVLVDHLKTEDDELVYDVMGFLCENDNSSGDNLDVFLRVWTSDDVLLQYPDKVADLMENLEFQYTLDRVRSLCVHFQKDDKALQRRLAPIRNALVKDKEEAIYLATDEQFAKEFAEPLYKSALTAGDMDAAESLYSKFFSRRPGPMAYVRGYGRDFSYLAFVYMKDQDITPARLMAMIQDPCFDFSSKDHCNHLETYLLYLDTVSLTDFIWKFSQLIPKIDAGSTFVFYHIGQVIKTHIQTQVASTALLDAAVTNRLMPAPSVLTDLIHDIDILNINPNLLAYLLLNAGARLRQAHINSLQEIYHSKKPDAVQLKQQFSSVYVVLDKKREACLNTSEGVRCDFEKLFPEFKEPARPRKKLKIEKRPEGPMPPFG